MIDFVPVVYEHAAALIGRSPWEVSRSADPLAGAHLAARKRYALTAVVVGIDLYNVEPEVYGARVADAGPLATPAVVEHPLAEVAQLARLSCPDWGSAGRWPLVLAAAERIRREVPTCRVALPVNGPFSLASSLLGFDRLLLACLDDPAGLRLGLERLTENQIVLVEIIAGRGFGITLFESGATPPLIGPDLFAEMETACLRAILAAGAGDGVAPPLVVGGDTCPILPELLATGAGALICPVETDQAAFMAGVADRPALRVRVNLAPDLFRREDPGPARAAFDRAADIAGSHPAASVGSGILSYDAIPACVDAVADRARRRANGYRDAT